MELIEFIESMETDKNHPATVNWLCPRRLRSVSDELSDWCRVKPEMVIRHQIKVRVSVKSYLKLSQVSDEKVHVQFKIFNYMSRLKCL